MRSKSKKRKLARRNRSAAIGMRLTSLLGGIVQSLACPSTRRLSPVTGFTSKIASWRREPRM